jgi:hypothetical protein
VNPKGWAAQTSRGRSGGSVIRRQIELTDTQLRHKLRDTSTEAIRDLGGPGGRNFVHVCPAGGQPGRPPGR